MTDSVPPLEPLPKRRWRPDRPFLEPHWHEVWLERAKVAWQVVDRPMTPDEACRAVAKALGCKIYEAGQVVAAADGMTIRWTGEKWTRV